MTGWPATVAPKWAIARNHAATVEEDVIREAPVVPAGELFNDWEGRGYDNSVPEEVTETTSSGDRTA